MRETPADPSRRAVILSYHRLASGGTDFWKICVSPETFRAHMELLRRDYRPMPLEDLARAAASGELPERAVAVTLDDGYDDAFVAADILVERGIPATFFVTEEGFDGAREFWWDTLEWVFRAEHPLPPSLELRLPERTVHLPTGDGAERAAALSELHGPIRRLALEEREAAVRRLLEWSGLPSGERHGPRPMSAAEAARLARRPGLRLGCHTAHHLSLPGQAPGTLRREVGASKARLEGVLGLAVTEFAYPFGEFDQAAVEAVREASFSVAVTTTAESVSRGARPLLLPRWTVSPCPARAFAEQLEAWTGGVPA